MVQQVVRLLTLLIGLLLISREAQANLSFVHPRPIGISASAIPFVSSPSATHRRPNPAKTEHYRPETLPLSDSAEFVPQPGHLLDSQQDASKRYFARAQSVVIGVLTAICFLLPPRDEGTRRWKPLRMLREIFFSATAIGTILVGVSISMVAKPSSVASSNNFFANGSMLILYSLAADLITVASSRRFSGKALVQSVIAVTLILFATNVFVLNRESLANAPLTQLYSFVPKAGIGLRDFLPSLIGQSAFFSVLQTLLIFIDFDSDSITSIGSACVLQVLIGGLFVLTSFRFSNNSLAQSSFAFLFAGFVIVFILAPRALGASEDTDLPLTKKKLRVSFSESVEEWHYVKSEGNTTKHVKFEGDTTKLSALRILADSEGSLYSNDISL